MVSHQIHDLMDDLFTITDYHGIEKWCQRFGIGGAWTATEHYRIVIAPVRGSQVHCTQLQQGQDACIIEFVL